jgi:hypothetical protein
MSSGSSARAGAKPMAEPPTPLLPSTNGSSTVRHVQEWPLLRTGVVRRERRKRSEPDAPEQRRARHRRAHADAASRIAPPVEADGADRSRARRAFRDRHRCEAMPRSSPRAASGLYRWRAIPSSVCRRTPVYEDTGGIGPDQFRVARHDGDCRVLRLSRNKTRAGQRLAYMKLTASIRGVQDQLVSPMRCSA